jgi:hypothetical protein
VSNDSDWTLTTLYMHLLAILEERDKRYGQRFTDLETALRAALAASEKAILKAEMATERRFEAVNEFRSTLSDQAGQFITRSEAEAATARNTERIQELTDRINRSEGRGAGLGAGWGYLVAAVGVIAAVIAIVLGIR